MGRHYSTRDFFRQMPDRLLARYFEGRGVLERFDFTALKETQPEELSAAWLELPEDQRNAMDADFREIHALSCEKGWCAIRDEAQWQFREDPNAFTVFVEKLGDLAGHFGHSRARHCPISIRIASERRLRGLEKRSATRSKSSRHGARIWAMSRC